MLLHCSLPSPVFDKYVYILWWCIRVGNVRSVLVSFHHQNWCFISIFAAIFAAASHILCDMNEIFSVWLNLSCAVLFGSVLFGWAMGIHSVMQFSELMVDLFFVWVSVSMQRFCVGLFRSSPLSLSSPSFSGCYSCGPCLENTLHKCKQRKTYVWCQCKHRIVINYTDKIISETFCHAVFLSNCFVDCRHRGRRRRSDLSHYYSLSNLIELLWYITFRFA